MKIKTLANTLNLQVITNVQVVVVMEIIQVVVVTKIIANTEMNYRRIKEMNLEINLPLTSGEAKVLFGVLDKYTDENYNEIASIVQGRLEDLIHEYEEDVDEKS